MQETGFWDYTCPLHGSLERYSPSDWDRLLDDMVDGGFGTLVLGIKWLTTGYRSRLPWLDQSEDAAAVSSDNRTLLHALEGARRRGITTRLLVVATQFCAREFGLKPRWVPEWMISALGRPIAMYDLDHPGLRERILLLFEEIAALFGQLTDGLIVELEFCDRDEPHRVPIYDRWASLNGRPDYRTIKGIDLQPRSYPFGHWRDFTTSRRIDLLKEVAAVVRAGGFTGELATIAEIDNGEMAVSGAVNLRMLRDEAPDWTLVTYDSIYDRSVNRLATADFCIEQPKSLGHTVHFLTRGVMTWVSEPFPLESQWRMSIDDAIGHGADGLFFMGADARLDGLVCSDLRLPLFGFSDGRAARLRLMELVRERRAEA